MEGKTITFEETVRLISEEWHISLEEAKNNLLNAMMTGELEPIFDETEKM
jgi:hypothetical protein